MNTRTDRLHLLGALAYATGGLGLGIYMAASHDHSQAVAHAHLMLVGFLLSFAYAVIGRLWLGPRPALLSGLQLAGHHLGVFGLIGGLLLLYGGAAPSDRLEPVLASASILVLASLVLMSAMVVHAGRANRAAPAAELVIE
ncbi:TonB-dependent receptor [Wenzhouxiangella limi]|uniref:TonB-dependent receptor n=1 Tax=Wenzhouxiangella limi TaxID=2707351 RepID=A0A845V0Q9_9GAMM|nr:TonB-dependent receptor [Wenzhouxiangella limi]NDY94866.1 TonB-dependent receptor [Wenzhouxiangella limi]